MEDGKGFELGFAMQMSKKIEWRKHLGTNRTNMAMSSLVKRTEVQDFGERK